MAATSNQTAAAQLGSPAPPSIQKHDDAEWGALQGIIKELYIDKNETTLEVQRYMAEFYAFKASVKQYERRFKKWGLRKNRTQSLYVSVHQELKRKRLTADDAEIMLNDDALSCKKLKKGISRHVRPTLSSKWAAESNLERITGCTEMEQDGTGGASVSIAITIRPALRQGKGLAKVDSVPWFKLADSISEQLFSSSLNPGMSGLNIRPGTFSFNSVQRPFGRASAARTNLVNEVLASLGGVPQGKTKEQNLMDLEALLIERQKGDFNDAMSTVRRSPSDALVSVLSYASYLLSNNLAQKPTRASLVNLFQASDAQAFAQSLSSSSLLSARAFISQILLAACEDSNLSLLEQLHAYGTDLNMPLPSSVRGQTALQIVIQEWRTSNVSLAFLKRLLELGAKTETCGRHPFADVDVSGGLNQFITSKARGCCCCSKLPMLQAAKHPKIVAVMLERGTRICKHFNMTLTVRKGADASLVQLLLDTCPTLAKQMPGGPYHDPATANQIRYWSPLQAATASDTSDMAEVVDVLLHKGAEVNVSSTSNFRDWASTLDEEDDTDFWKFDIFGDGELRSPLALALYHGNSAVAVRLLESGADPNTCYLDLLNEMHQPGFVSTDQLRETAAENYWRFRFEEVALDEQDDTNLVFTPLQAAVASHSVSNVQLVLDAGGRVTCDFGFQPLVLAAMTGDNRIVQMLLARGALVDGFETFVPDQHRSMSPLAYASANGFIPVMNSLIEAGADINHCHPVNGLTPLQAALAFKAPRESTELLLTCEAIDVWHPGSAYCGINAFAAAFIHGDETMIDLLVSHIKATTVLGETAAETTAVLNAEPYPHWYESSFLKTYESLDNSCSATKTTPLEAFSQILRIGRQLLRSSTKESIAGGVFARVVRSGQPDLAWGVLQQNVEIPLPLSMSLLREFRWRENSEQTLESDCDLIEVVLASFTSACPDDARGRKFSMDVLRIYYDWKNAYDKGPQAISSSRCLSTILGAVKTLIGNGILVSRPGHETEAVHVAVRHRDLEMVTCLIEQKACINAFRFGFTRTPLQIAVCQGHADMVDYLVLHGADVNSPPCDTHFWGYSALGAACHYGNLDIVKKLVVAKVDMNAPASLYGLTALAVAAAEGYQSIVSELIHNGANVNIAASENARSRTALQAACGAGQLDIVKILINNDADVNAVAGSRHGVTALQAAAIRGYFTICQILIGYGAKVSAAAGRYKGRTAIDGAAERGRLDLVKFLLDNHDGDEDIIEVCGRARWYARREGHMIVDELLATYKQSATGTNPILPPSDRSEETDSSDDEEIGSSDDEESTSDDSEVLSHHGSDTGTTDEEREIRLGEFSSLFE